MSVSASPFVDLEVCCGAESLSSETLGGAMEFFLLVVSEECDASKLVFTQLLKMAVFAINEC